MLIILLASYYLQKHSHNSKANPVRIKSSVFIACKCAKYKCLLHYIILKFAIWILNTHIPSENKICKGKPVKVMVDRVVPGKVFSYDFTYWLVFSYLHSLGNITPLAAIIGATELKQHDTIIVHMPGIHFTAGCIGVHKWQRWALFYKLTY